MSSKKSWHYENIIFEDLPWRPTALSTKFRSYRGKQNKIKQNKKPFCEEISQRIENDPDLLDLNDVGHCGLWGVSATLPVSQNLTTKRWIVLLPSTLPLPKSLLHCRCVKRTDFVAKYASMIFCRLLHSKSSCVKRISQACCLHNLKNMEKNCKTQLWDEKQNRALFWATLYYVRVALKQEEYHIYLAQLTLQSL